MSSLRGFNNKGVCMYKNMIKVALVMSLMTGCSNFKIGGLVETSINSGFLAAEHENKNAVDFKQLQIKGRFKNNIVISSKYTKDHIENVRNHNILWLGAGYEDDLIFGNVYKGVPNALGFEMGLKGGVKKMYHRTSLFHNKYLTTKPLTVPSTGLRLEVGYLVKKDLGIYSSYTVMNYGGRSVKDHATIGIRKLF